jgi:hypothetical protein
LIFSSIHPIVIIHLEGVKIAVQHPWESHGHGNSSFRSCQCHTDGTHPLEVHK